MPPRQAARPTSAPGGRNPDTPATQHLHSNHAIEDFPAIYQDIDRYLTICDRLIAVTRPLETSETVERCLNEIFAVYKLVFPRNWVGLSWL